MISIPDVSKRSGISSRTLRVWEQAGLLHCERDKNGIRHFSETIYEEIRQIQQLKELGLTLKEIASTKKNKTERFLKAIVREKRLNYAEKLTEVSHAYHKLLQVESLLQEDSQGQSDIASFFPNKEKLHESLLRLLRKKGQPNLKARLHFLQEEIKPYTSYRMLGFLAKILQLKHKAQELNLPLCFLRGQGASSLMLNLLGVHQVDPVAYELVPAYGLEVPLHFDIPFSETGDFLEWLMRLNLQGEGAEIVAFRLPLLDILQDFWSRSNSDPYRNLPESCLIEAIGQGSCEYVFGLDESGDNYVYRLFPELSPEIREPRNVKEDLLRFGVRCLDDVFRFQALRREKSYAGFLDHLAGQKLPLSGSRLSAEIPVRNLGKFIYREELVRAASAISGWSVFDIMQLRRYSTQSDRQKFAAATDERCLEEFFYWNEIVFHKVHLVSQWQLTALSLSCKIANSDLWERCIQDWEDRNGFKWNDIGVVYKGATFFNH